VEIWVIVSIQKPSHHIWQTFRPLRMFKVVFVFRRVPRQFTLSETIVFILSAKGVRKGGGWG